MTRTRRAPRRRPPGDRAPGDQPPSLLGDADRDRLASLLREHYAQGRTKMADLT